MKKHIDISKYYMDNGERKNWLHTINAKGIHVSTVNGISIFQTRRNYYRDSKKNKIRYETMNCSNASCDFLHDIYAEVYPGIYCYMAIASENNISEKLELVSNHVKALSDKNINSWRETLIRL